MTLLCAGCQEGSLTALQGWLGWELSHKMALAEKVTGLKDDLPQGTNVSVGGSALTQFFSLSRKREREYLKILLSLITDLSTEEALHHHLQGALVPSP